MRKMDRFFNVIVYPSDRQGFVTGYDLGRAQANALAGQYKRLNCGFDVRIEGAPYPATVPCLIIPP